MGKESGNLAFTVCTVNARRSAAAERNADFFPDGVDERALDVAAHEEERERGKSAAGTEVEEATRRAGRREEGKAEERVEEMGGRQDARIGRTRGHEIHALIPLEEEREIRLERVAFARRRLA